jgi:NitT/TauT family transport system permease protein
VTALSDREITESAPERRTREGSLWRDGLALLLPPFVTLVLIIAAWDYVSWRVLKPGRRWLLPSPNAVLKSGYSNADTRVQLFNALGVTAETAIIGLLIAVVVGVSLAVLMIQARWLERAIQPLAVVLQTTPLPVITPLFGFWWGYDLPSRLVVVVLIALFPIIVNTLDGLHQADPTMHDLLTLHKAGRSARLIKLQLPAALPSFFTGLRIAGTNAVIGSVVADFFFKQGQPGLGILVDVYRQQVRIDQALATALLAVLLGAVVFGLFSVLRHFVVGRWAPRRWS